MPASDAATSARRRAVVLALSLFVAVRVAGVLALALWAHAEGTTAHARLVRWDAQWYAGIAAHGYGSTRVVPDGRHLSDLAFFPLYPALERAVSWASGLPPGDAGLVVTAVASLLAAGGIYAVGERVAGARAGVVLVVLWAAVPVGIVESMAYSEAVFTALAAWCLHAVLTDRWPAAAALAVAAGLARPVGIAVAAAVVAAVLVAGARGRRTPRGAAMRPPPAAVGAAVVAPLGWLGYLVWVAVRTGDPLGYFAVAGRWGNSFDGGRAFAAWIWQYLTGPRPGLGVLLVAGVLALLGLLGLSVRDRQPVPLLVFAGLMVAVTLTSSGYFGSKPRYLLPAFPLLLPLAARITRLPPRARGTLLAALAAGSAVYGAAWLLGPGPP